MSNATSPASVEVLRCRQCGTEWQRPVVRGRKPHKCAGCRQRLTSEQRSAIAKAVSDRAAPEQRSALASKAAKARWAGVPPDERSEICRRTALAGWGSTSTKLKGRLYGPPRPCTKCSAPLSMNPLVRYCGAPACRRAYNNERARVSGLSRIRTRAKRYGLTLGKFTYLEVFERDGWVCGICDGPVDRELRWPDPWSPSLDHIVPMARGGQHLLENVQCAHLRCNISKGART